jgi:hypothetical protein
MSSTDNLKIDTAELAAAAGKSAAAQDASASAPISPPSAATVGSPVDAAAAAFAGAIQAILKAHDAADIAAVAKQTAALTESPLVIAEQDHQGADEITAAGATILEFPIPVAGSSVSGKVWAT